MRTNVRKGGVRGGARANARANGRTYGRTYGQTHGRTCERAKDVGSTGKRCVGRTGKRCGVYVWPVIKQTCIGALGCKCNVYIPLLYLNAPKKNIIMSKWVDVSWVSQCQVGLLGNNFPSYLPPQNVFPEYVFFGPLTYFDKGLPHAKFPSKMPDKSPPYPLLTFHCNSTF